MRNETTNPYVKGAEGKKLWDDRYFNMKESIKRWQMAFFAVSVMAITLTLAIAKMATQSRVQPFVVETSQGMPYAIKALQPSMSSTDQRLINFAINQFIVNTRSVLSDESAQAALLNKSYAYAAEDALQTLRDYFSRNNPYDVAKKYTVSVAIINAMPLSPHTWQITWDETQHFQDSTTPPVTQRWMADVTYQFGEINKAFINDNPFGLYVVKISWSQSQIREEKTHA